MSDRKHQKWLRSQLSQWFDAGLIDNTQSQAISDFYPPDTSNSRTIFSTIGAILFGLGIILFFAYNWQEMHRFLKLFIIFAVVSTAHLGAIWFSSGKNENASASEGLATLGNMGFGAGGLAWRLRSPLLLFLSIALFFLLWFGSLFEVLGEKLIYLVYGSAVLLIAVGMLVDSMVNKAYSSFREALLLPGYLVYLVMVLSMTFNDFQNGIKLYDPLETDFQTIIFWFSFGISLITPLMLVLPKKSFQKPIPTDRSHALLLMITSLLFFIVGAGWLDVSTAIFTTLMNLIFIGHCFMFISHGSKIQRGWEVAAGCVLFSILVFSRYTDLFSSLLSRSLVFLVLGASLFVIGNFYSRQKQVDDHG